METKRLITLMMISFVVIFIGLSESRRN